MNKKDVKPEPLNDQQKPSPGSSPYEGKTLGKKSSLPSIVIIDDDKDAVDSLAYILTEQGYKCTSAYDAKSGLEACFRLKPSLIILDIQLPDMVGFEVLIRLKREQLTASVPIIMWTGKFVNPSEKAQGLELGAIEYLSKPVSVDLLLGKIKRILG